MTLPIIHRSRESGSTICGVDSAYMASAWERTTCESCLVKGRSDLLSIMHELQILAQRGTPTSLRFIQDEWGVGFFDSKGSVVLELDTALRVLYVHDQWTSPLFPTSDFDAFGERSDAIDLYFQLESLVNKGEVIADLLKNTTQKRLLEVIARRGRMKALDSSLAQVREAEREIRALEENIRVAEAVIKGGDPFKNLGLPRESPIGNKHRLWKLQEET